MTRDMRQAVGIISWQGMNARAKATAEALCGAGLAVTVVYSSDSEADETGAGHWVRVPQEQFFGAKFDVLLDHIAADETLLLVQADAECDDWPALAARFTDVLTRIPGLGLLTPEIENTPYPLNVTGVGQYDESGLFEVLHTDAIVLVIAPAIVERLRGLDFSLNNLGWGIDWTALCHARAQGMLALCDRAIKVRHPEGRGYDWLQAESQMREFVTQMTDTERDHYETIRAQLQARSMLRSRTLHISDPTGATAPREGPMQAFVPGSRLDGLNALVLTGGQLQLSTTDPVSAWTVGWDGGSVPLRPAETGTETEGETADSMRVLPFRYTEDSGLSFAPATDPDYVCPGQQTSRVLVAQASPAVAIDMIEPINLPDSAGTYTLFMGLAVHRADVDLLIRWSDPADPRTTPVEHWIKLDQRFNGETKSSNFQPVRVTIPTTGATRRLELRLCYWGTESAARDPAPMIFVTQPVLVNSLLVDDAMSPLILTNGADTTKTLHLNATIPPVDGSLYLIRGETRIPLLQRSGAEISHSFDNNRLVLTSTIPQPATLMINGHAYCPLWLGPSPLSVELPARLLTDGAAVIDIRDATGSIELAHLRVDVPRIDASSVISRHLDAWIVEPHFDTAFYLSGFAADQRPEDPISHYLEDGWTQGRDPAPWFSTWHYLARHADVARLGINPFVHFCHSGEKEGRTLIRMGRQQTGDSDQPSLFGQVFSAATGARSPHFAPLTDRRARVSESLPQLIAFYLPQFHPIPENDEWWGKGFTEWTNVSKAVPQFAGHNQPRLPGELGYYDLRQPEVMERQIALAQQFGLSGFCFHYYWFAGHRLLEAPLDQFLARKDAAFDFPFCLCWANENWTRRWDGAEEDILMRQTHGVEDHAAVFDDLLRYIDDPRYIKIDNQPVIVVYRPSIIDDEAEMVRIWRAKAREAGYDDLLLVASNAFGFDDPASVGFDALCEFPPHNVSAPDIQHTLQFYNSGFDGRVFPFETVVDYSLDRLDHISGTAEAARYYPTVMAGWDNEARKPGRGNVFHGADPVRFHRWLAGAARFSRDNHPDGGRMVFVNAWNEWAEGTYLEPDRWFGYGYLNAVAALADTLDPLPVEAAVLPADDRPVELGRGAILIHAFYDDLIDELAEHVRAPHLRDRFDVLLTVPAHWTAQKAEAARVALGAKAMWITPNIGRDIFPFLTALDHAVTRGYDFALKIHTKKSPHLRDGGRWRQAVLSSLLGPEAVERAVAAFADDTRLGLLAPESQFLPIKGEMSLRDNQDNVEQIVNHFDLDIGACDRFVAGSMFWFRPAALARLAADPLPAVEFGPELGAIDGTLAHAFERLFATIVASAGYEVAGYSAPGDFNPYL